MPASFVVRSRRVVLPDGERPAAVVVADGRITEIRDHGDVSATAEMTDLGDVVVLPGVVDTHVHVNEPGRTSWEGFASATRAAAAGGVTTIVDMPLNSIPPTTTVGALERKRAAATDRVLVDVGFWGGIVPENADELGPLVAAGVCGFKSFLCDSGVPEFPAVTLDELARALDRLRGLDTVVLVHAEDPAVLVEANDASGDPTAHGTWLASRPPAAEAHAVRAVSALAERAGVRLHVVHVSAAQALAELRAARRRAARSATRSTWLTAETCPHYLLLAAEDVPAGATVCKCAPPIREAANAEQLWAALADGTIDLVASDHSPSPPAGKHLDDGDFLRAWGGIASLQLTLPLVWTGATARGHDLAAVARWLSTRPAELAGLDGKGGIRPGGDADLVAFDPDVRWTVRGADLQHRHPLTPYEGRPVQGRVLATWVRGRQVYRWTDAGPSFGPATGQLLRRSRAVSAAGGGAGHRTREEAPA